MKRTLLILLVTLSFEILNVEGQNLEWTKVSTVLGGQVSSFSIVGEKIMVASPYTSFFYSDNFGESYGLIDKVGFDDAPKVFVAPNSDKSIFVKDNQSYFYTSSNAEIEEITFENEPVHIIHLDKKTNKIYKQNKSFPYGLSVTSFDNFNWKTILDKRFTSYAIDGSNIAAYNGYNSELYISTDDGLNYTTYDLNGIASIAKLKFYDGILYGYNMYGTTSICVINGNSITNIIELDETHRAWDFEVIQNQIHVMRTDSILTYSLSGYNLLNNQKVNEYQSYDVLGESIYMMDAYHLYEYNQNVNEWVTIKETRFEAQRTYSLSIFNNLTFVTTRHFNNDSFTGSIHYKKEGQNNFNLLSSPVEKFLGNKIQYLHGKANQLTLISNTHLIRIDVSFFDSPNTESIEVKKAFENDIVEAIYYEGNYYLLGYEEGHVIRIFNNDFETISSFNVDAGNKAHLTILEDELILLTRDRIYSVSTNSIQAKSFITTPSKFIRYGNNFYSFLTYPDSRKIYKSANLDEWSEIYEFDADYDLYDFKFVNEKYLLVGHWRGVSYLNLEDLTLTDLPLDGLENIDSRNMGFSSFDYTNGKLYVQYERGGATYELDLPLLSPSLSTPVNEQVNVGTLTEFTWNEVESSVSYHLQISTDNQFSSTVFDSSKVGSSSFTLTEPLSENTTYFWRMKSISDNELRDSEWSDTLTFTTGIRTSIEDEPIPQEYQLVQNYPNPFNPSTQIQYALPEATQVTLEVFNSLGQKVMELVNGQQSAGYHTVTFGAAGLSSGVYLYKLTTPSFTQTKKMLLMK